MSNYRTEYGGIWTQTKYSNNPKVNMQKFSFQYFVFIILNQSFEARNKHLTNKVCGLKPADSSAWHISSVELSPHKHFQKKKLPEARISWHYEHYLKPQSLSLHLDKSQSIDQVPVSAIQKNRLHSGSPGVHLPASLTVTVFSDAQQGTHKVEIKTDLARAC